MTIWPKGRKRVAEEEASGEEERVAPAGRPSRDVDVAMSMLEEMEEKAINYIQTVVDY